MANRRMNSPDLPLLLELYDEHRRLQFTVAEMRKQRNRNAEAMAKNRSESIVKDGVRIKRLLHEYDLRLAALEQRLFSQARLLPNDCHPSVPVGDESKAFEVAIHGHQRSNSAFPLLTHVQLSRMHGLAEFERAGKTTGSSFYFLRGLGAMLELALVRYATDMAIAKGFEPVIVPDVIRYDVLQNCGFSPRSTDPQTYFIEDHSITDSDRFERDPKQLCLSATAEFPLAAMYANESLDQLPIKMVGCSHAFRAEGQAGASNRGLYRVHQFTKVELFAITAASQSQQMFESFIDIQTDIFKGLELCFRVLNMPTEELGAPAFIKYDMEAWMPGRNAWGEISSTSNCTDYQARRLGIRHFSKGPRQLSFCHTVNGTACAVPRLIVALLETHQRQDGSIYIPEKLRPYLLGKDISIVKPGASMSQQ